MFASHGIIQSIKRGPALLLDDYAGATVACSLRKLKSTYTGYAIRVRRSSDDTEQDIGFVNNLLDETALINFVGNGGSDNGFVVKWYDQSENSDFSQPIASEQPKIVDAGTVIKINSKSAIRFDGSNDNLIRVGFVSVASSSYMTSVAKRNSSGSILVTLAGNQYLFTLFSDNNYYLQASTAGYQASNSTDTTNSQILLTGLNNGTSQKMYKNGSEISSSFVSFSLDQTAFKIGQYGNFGQYHAGEIQEVVFYNSNQETNRSGIELNVNTYYAVY